MNNNKKMKFQNTDGKNRKIRIFNEGILVEIKPREFDQFMTYAEKMGFKDDFQKALYQWCHEEFTMNATANADS